MENIQIKIEALKLKHARKLKQCDLMQANLQIAYAAGMGASVDDAVKGIAKLLNEAVNIENQIAKLGNTHID
jgi:uncharacterized protein with PhoU and TrkA domain